MQHLSIALQTLRDHRLFGKLSKYEFRLDSVTLLGHTVSKDGTMVEITNIEAIRDLVRPSSPYKARSFIGLVVYYRQFFEGFAAIVL